MKVLKATYTPTKWVEKWNTSIPDPDNAVTVFVVKITRAIEFSYSSDLDIVFFDIRGDLGVDTIRHFSNFRWEKG